MVSKKLLLCAITASLISCFSFCAANTPKWNTNLGMPIVGSPVVGPNNTLYVSTADGESSAHLWALDATTGIKKWAYTVPFVYISMPAVDITNGNVVVSTNADTMDIPGKLFFFTANGQLTTTVAFDDEKSTGKIVLPGNPSIEANTGNVYVPLTIDPNISYIPTPIMPVTTVVQVWNSQGTIIPTTFPQHQFPIINRAFPLYTLAERSMCLLTGYGVSCTTLACADDPKCTGAVNIGIYRRGTSVLSLPNAGMFSPLLTNANASLFVYSDNLGYIRSVTATGAPAWFTFLGGDVSQAPITFDSNNELYLGSSTGYLYIMNPDGTYKSQFFIDRSGINQRLAIDEKNKIIYAGLANGAFVAIDASSGKVLWTQSINIATAPVLGSDGTVFVGSNAGTVYAFSSTTDEEN